MILRHHPHAKVEAIDISPRMLEVAQQMISHNRWQSQVTVHEMDSCNLQFPDSHFDLQIANFSIFYTLPPEAAAREMHRTVKKNAFAVATCWKGGAVFAMVFEAQAVIKPQRSVMELMLMGKFMAQGKLKSVLESASFRHVQVHECSVYHETKSDDEMVAFIVANVRTLVSRHWTEEEMGRLNDVVQGILNQDRARWLTVDEPERKSIEYLAWIGVGQK
ncbi:MAG: hypothetical protein Q9162_004568 [Coniocarpon cinnabarinum]